MTRHATVTAVLLGRGRVSTSSAAASVLLVFLLLAGTTSAVTRLLQGDIALVQYGSISGQDRLTLVTLRDLDAGTSFKVTDRGWNARYKDASGVLFDTDSVLSSFTDTVSQNFEESVGEGTLTYTASGPVPAGTLIEWVEGGANTDWSGVAGNLFQNGGDQVIVYRGDAPIPCFIWAWTNTGQGGFEDSFDDVGDVIDGRAKDNELDSDYPYNWADLTATFNPSSLVGLPSTGNTHISEDETNFRDGGEDAASGTCGEGSGQRITWPELPHAPTYTYTGPVVGQQSVLAELLASPQYFSSMTGASAPTPITALFTLPTEDPVTTIASTLGPVFTNNKIVPVAVTTGTPEQADGTGAGIQTTFRLAVLETIPAGTELYVTDRALLDATPAGDTDIFHIVVDADGDPVSGEGTLKFTPSLDVAPGSIIDFTGDTTGEWTIVEGELEFSVTGDSLLVYTFDHFGRLRPVSQLHSVPSALSAPPTVDETLVVTNYMNPLDDMQTGFDSLDVSGLVGAQAFYYQGADAVVSGRCDDIIAAVKDTANNWLATPPPTALNSFIVESSLSTEGLRITYLKSSNDDMFSFLLLEPVVAGTRIYFRDSQNGVIAFTAAQGYPAGSSITFDAQTSLGSAEWESIDYLSSGNTFNLDASMDILLAFQGPAAAAFTLTALYYGQPHPGSPPLYMFALDGNDLEYRGPRTGTVHDLRRSLTNPALWNSDANSLPSVTTPFSLVDTLPGTQLAEGDVAIVFVENDGDPQFHLMSLVELAAGTQLFVTDMSIGGDGLFFTADWSSQPVSTVTDEGTLMFTASTTIAPGTVLKVRANGQPIGTGVPGTWEAIRGEIKFNTANGDQLFVFQARTVNPCAAPGSPNPEFMAQFTWGMDWTSNGDSVLQGAAIQAGDNVENGWLTGATATVDESYVPDTLTETVQLPGRDGTGVPYSSLTFVGAALPDLPTLTITGNDPLATAGVSGTREALLYYLRKNEFHAALPASPATPVFAVGVVSAGPTFPTATWLLESATSAVVPADEFFIQTSLAAGDAIIISAQSGDGVSIPLTFQFMFLKPVVEATFVQVTDRGWTTTGFIAAVGEDVWGYYVPPGGHPAGTVVSGSVSNYNLDLAAGDQLFLFQPTPDPLDTRFLFGLHWDGADPPTFSAAGAAAADAIDSELPPGLGTSTTNDVLFGAVVLRTDATPLAGVEFRGPRTGTPEMIAIAATNNRFWYRSTTPAVLPMFNAFTLTDTNPAPPTVLTRGDVMIVRAEQVADAFAVDVVPLVDLAGGTCFYVTNAPVVIMETGPPSVRRTGAFESGDTILSGPTTIGTVQYCAPGGGTLAGTVLTFANDAGAGFTATELGISFVDQLTIVQYDWSRAVSGDNTLQQLGDAEEQIGTLLTGCRPEPDDYLEMETCLADGGAGGSEVYLGPLTGDKPGLVDAIASHLFWHMADVSQASPGDATVTATPPMQATKLAPGDVVIVSIEQSSTADMVQLLALVDILEGTTLCLTDNAGITTTEAVDDGVSCWTAPSGGMAAGGLFSRPGPDWVSTSDSMSIAADDVVSVFQYDMSEVDPVVPIWQFDALGPVTPPSPLTALGAFTSLFAASQGPNWVYRGPTTGAADSIRDAVATHSWWVGNGADVSSELVAPFTILDPETAPTAGLDPGCVAFVRVQSADPGVVPAVPAEFDLVVLADVAEGAVIYVSNVDWSNTEHAFGEATAPEGVVGYSVGAGGLTAGTVLHWPSPDWTFVYGSLDVAPATFLHAFQFNPLSPDVGSPIEFLWGFESDGTPFPSALVSSAAMPMTTSVPPAGCAHFVYNGPTVGMKDALQTALSMDMYWSCLPSGVSEAALAGEQDDFVVGMGGTTALAPGDVAVVRVDAAGPSVVEFVFLKSVAAGTQLFLTDQGWAEDAIDPTTGAFQADASDGVVRYTVPVGGHPAGTVVQLVLGPSLDDGFAAAAGAFGLGAEDQVFLYQHASDPTFLWLWDFSQSGIEALPTAVTGPEHTNQPPSLAGFTTSLLPYQASQTENTAAYMGPTTGDVATLQAALALPVFWATAVGATFAAVPDFTVGATPPPGTTLTAGDVAVVEVFSSGSLSFQLVALVELAQGTEFYVTDFGWAAGSFFLPPSTTDGNVEGLIKFTASDGAVPAGAVLASTDSRMTTLTDAIDFDTTSGDQLFLFQWNGPSPTFIWGWDNTGEWEADAADVTDATNSMLPAGLGGHSSVVLLFAPDYTYTGPTDGTKSVLQTAIAQGTNIEPVAGRRLYTTFWLTSVNSNLPALFNINAVLTVTELGPGCVTVVSYSSTSFQLMLLSEIGPGTEIYITDNGFISNNVVGFTNGGDDGTIKYTASATLPAGTILSWANSVMSDPEWSVVEAGFNPEANDQLILFQYYNSPTPTFLWALDVTGAWETTVTDLVSNTESEAPTLATQHTQLASGVASARYGGSVTTAPTSGTKDAWIASIADASNWETDTLGGFVSIAQGELIVETTLAECDVAVVGYFPGSTVQLLALADLAEGTRVFATSRGWDGSAFFASPPGPEGTATYTAPTGGTSAGALITLDTSAEGWPVAAGDTVLVYQGVDEDTPSTFLWAYATSPFSAVQSIATSQLPMGLETCNTERASPAAAAFDGPASAEKADFQAAIADPANWVDATSPLQGPFVVQLQTLAPGCVAVVNFHSHEVLDQVQLLVVENMAQGATFFVTDSGWSANGFLSHPQDCILQFTAPGPLTSGTVITWTESQTPDNTAAGWSVLQCPLEGFKLTNQGESLLVYHAPQSAPTQPTTFLWGFKNSGPWDTAAPTALTPLETYSTLPDSISEYNTVLAHMDNYKYKGVMCGQKEVVVASISNPLFWVGNDNSDLASVILMEAFEPDAFDIGTCDITTLTPGCIAVVEYQADVNGGTVADGALSAFKLLVLDDILAGTTIFVTDGAWDNTNQDFTLESASWSEGAFSYTTTDGILRYVFPADTPAGTIIVWEEGGTNPGWESTGPTLFDLSPHRDPGPTVTVAGDQILVFASQSANPDFLFGMDTTRNQHNPDGWEADVVGALVLGGGAVPVNAQSELPTGLTAEVALTNDYLNFVYTGPTTGTKTSLLSAIGTYGPDSIQTSVFWYGTSGTVASLPPASQLPVSFVIAADNQQALNPGNLVIVEFDIATTDAERFQLLATVDIAAGTTFCVTDKDWISDTEGWTPDEEQDGDDDTDDGDIDEGTVCYTAAALIPKGSLVEYAAGAASAEWETTDEGFQPSDGDGLFVFQFRGIDLAPRHIWAYQHTYVAQPLPTVLSTDSDSVPAFQFSTKDTDNSAQRSVADLDAHLGRTPTWLAYEVSVFANWDSQPLTAPTTQPMIVQTELYPGDVAVVAYRPQDATTGAFTTHLQFLLTVDVCKGTQFIVHNCRFNEEDTGTDVLSFDVAAEACQVMMYVAQADLPAGTVLTYGGPAQTVDDDNVGAWIPFDDAWPGGRSGAATAQMFQSTATSGELLLPTTGATVYVMQWTVAAHGTSGMMFDSMSLPARMLWAIDATDDGFDGQASTTAEGALPTSLVGFSTALNQADFAGKYTGSFLGGRDATISRVTDLANWEGASASACPNAQVCQLFGSPLEAGVTLTSCPSTRVGNDLVVAGMVHDTAVTTSVTIDWGDGSAVTTVAVAAMEAGPTGTNTAVFTASHGYENAGLYTVVVTAVDGVVGNTDPTDSKTVTVDPAAPPMITITPPSPAVDETMTSTLSGVVTETINRRLLKTVTGRRLAVVSVTIDWGDGSPLETVAVNPDGTFSASHTYPNNSPVSTPGWTATVTATNADGTTTVSTIVTVNNLPPAVALTMPDSIPQHGTVCLTGVVSDPNPLDSFEMLMVSWGDGVLSTFSPMDVSHPDLTWNPLTGEFKVTHMYTDPAVANTFVIQVQVFDDDMSASPWATTTVTTVPECFVSGGLTLWLPVSCDQVAFDTLTAAKLEELKQQIALAVTAGSGVTVPPRNVLVMSVICTPGPGASSDAIVTFKIVGLSDSDAIVVAAVLAAITTGSNTTPVPLLPFTISGMFGAPVTECQLCDPSCVTCVDVTSSSCSSCPDGSMLAGPAPAACVPLPSTTASPSASGSTSTTASGSVTPSATPSSSFGSIRDVNGAGIVNSQAAGQEQTVAAPSSAASQSPASTPSSSTSSEPSASETPEPSPSTTPSVSEAAAAASGDAPSADAGAATATDDAGAAGPKEAGSQTMLFAAVGGGVLVGVAVVAVVGVLYVRAKRRATEASGGTTTATGGKAVRRRPRSKRPPSTGIPTGAPSTLWRAMHAPPTSDSRGPSPDSPA